MPEAMSMVLPALKGMVTSTTNAVLRRGLSWWLATEILHTRHSDCRRDGGAEAMAQGASGVQVTWIETNCLSEFRR